MNYMTLGYENLLTIFIAIIGFVIVLFSQISISSNYNKYKRIRNNKKISGQEVARMILDKNGLTDVHVVSVNGNLTDHYDPTRKVVRLSNEIFDGTSIAALSVAAHECGHAIQDKENYTFMRIRSALVPFVNFVTYLGYFSLIISLIAGITGYLIVGILILLATLLFQIVTLPVEFDASKRAQEELQKCGLIEKQDTKGATKVLKAAAFTYVAGFLASALQIARLLLISRNRD